VNFAAVGKPEEEKLRVLCLNVPNLNLLGVREPDRYGSVTLEEITRSLASLASELGAQIESRQSNHEGTLIDWLQQAEGDVDALLINPGGLTHTSVSLRDAVSALDVPTFEVHLTNVYARESFRHTSLIADVCVGRVMGFGAAGYALALRGATEYLRRRPPS